MKSIVAMIGLAVCLASTAKTWKWTFDAAEAGKPPRGFSFARTGDGTEGTWVVRESADGNPTPVEVSQPPRALAGSKSQVLAQTGADASDYRFPLALADEPSLADVSVAVRFRPLSGKVDQAGGLVFRYADPNSYYVVRANALEDNCRIYRVVAGKRVLFGDKSVKVASGRWHTLKVTAKGNAFHVWLDGESVIETTDDTIKGAGKVGVWTKADSVTEFDDLEVEAVESKG